MSAENKKKWLKEALTICRRKRMDIYEKDARASAIEIMLENLEPLLQYHKDVLTLTLADYRFLWEIASEAWTLYVKEVEAKVQAADEHYGNSLKKNKKPKQ